MFLPVSIVFTNWCGNLLVRQFEHMWAAAVDMWTGCDTRTVNVYLQHAFLDLCVVLLQYEAQIDAIVEQAQQVGLPDEGLWCCTI